MYNYADDIHHHKQQHTYGESKRMYTNEIIVQVKLIANMINVLSTVETAFRKEQTGLDQFLQTRS